MVVVGGKAETLEEAREMLKAVIQDGSALELFGRLIEAQGGRCGNHSEYIATPYGKIPN